MKIAKLIETLFKKVLPSPFTIAVLLTLLTVILAFTCSSQKGDIMSILGAWEKGIWNNNLLVFAYQMMLILVLGHVLVLSKPANSLIDKLTSFVSSGTNAVVLVSFTTILVAFFNWGLGLIFGAILARKVAEHAQRNQISINYPLVGAAGYSGLMVWHGGLSGSAPLDAADTSKSLSSMLKGGNTIAGMPDYIPTSDTIFSWWNITIFIVILIVIPLFLYFLSKRATPTTINLPKYHYSEETHASEGAEKLDQSKILALIFGLLLLVVFCYRYGKEAISFNFTLNALNLLMFSLAILLHGNVKRFIKAIEEAIKDTSGILIQFPLYFGIMGIMTSSGMVSDISDFFASIANETTMPLYTFFSAGLVNIFVPSGGGQWAVQGPIVIEAAMKLDVPLPKAIMALAYGDQITNMLQPFWALPLLGITKLKAKEILPYTLLMMVVGSLVYLLGLLIL